MSPPLAGPYFSRSAFSLPVSMIPCSGTPSLTGGFLSCGPVFRFDDNFALDDAVGTSEFIGMELRKKNSRKAAAGRLPPLNALRAFEVAARHLSMTRAAEDLNVTPGPVSPHARLLEDRKMGG